MKAIVQKNNNFKIKIILQDYPSIILKILKKHKGLDIKLDEDYQYYIEIYRECKEAFIKTRYLLNFCKKYKKYEASASILSTYRPKIESEAVIKIFKENKISSEKTELYVTIDNNNDILYSCYILDNKLMIDPSFYLKLENNDNINIQYISKYITCEEYDINEFIVNDFFI